MFVSSFCLPQDAPHKGQPDVKQSHATGDLRQAQLAALYVPYHINCMLQLPGGTAEAVCLAQIYMMIVFSATIM